MEYMSDYLTKHVNKNDKQVRQEVIDFLLNKYQQVDARFFDHLKRLLWNL